MALVSAVPENLISYGVGTIEMDSRLSQQGKRLQSAIDALNRSAPDPKVLGPVPALGSQVAAYAGGNAGVDAWVGDVGNAFRNADPGLGLLGPLAVQAEQSVIDALVKGEEPQGAMARGAQLLRAQEAGQNGFVNLLSAGKSALSWVLSNQWWLTTPWGAGAKGGALASVVATIARDYRLVPSSDGKYVIAKGTRYLTQDATWLQRWIQSGRLRGTRYSATSEDVAKLLSLKSALKGDLKAALNPLSKDFYTASKVGGGAVAETLSLGSDIYDYSLGDKRKIGFGSQFAASVTVDTATTVGTVGVSDTAGAVASAGASWAAGAFFGADAGTVVPGVGTVIGFAAGAGIGYLMNTSIGKTARDDAVKGVTTAYHAVSDVVTHPGKDVKAVEHFVSDLNPF